MYFTCSFENIYACICAHTYVTVYMHAFMHACICAYILYMFISIHFYICHLLSSQQKSKTLYNGGVHNCQVNPIKKWFSSISPAVA